jgi:hypothetical protein
LTGWASPTPIDVKDAPTTIIPESTSWSIYFEPKLTYGGRRDIGLFAQAN